MTNLRSRSFRLLAATLVVVGLLGLTSCRGGNPAPVADDMLRLLKGQSKNVDELAGSPFVPKHARPRVVELPTQAAVDAEAEVLVRPALDVPPEQQWKFVDTVCQAADVFEVLIGDPADAAAWALSQDDSFASYAVQARGLAANLMAAGSSGEVAEILARALVCQLASANA